MTSSATSTAGFVSNPKTPIGGPLGRAEPTADEAFQSDDGFDAAFEAIRKYSRQAIEGKAPDLPGDRPVEKWNRPAADLSALSAVSEDQDVLPAAGDLLLTGGALTPEGDDLHFDLELVERQEQSEPPEGDQSKVGDDLNLEIEVPQIAAATTEVVAAVKSVIDPKTGSTDKRPAEAIAIPHTDARPLVAPDQGPKAAPRTDPFEALRHLTGNLGRQQESAKPGVIDADPNVDSQRAAIKNETLPREERLSVNTQAGDRSSPLVTRDTWTPAPANLTVVEARQIPAVAPTSTNASAVVSAISAGPPHGPP